MRTRVRNRIHALLGRQEGLALPQASDPFSVKSVRAMERLELGEPDGRLLRDLLELHAHLNERIKAQEKEIRAAVASDPRARLLSTVPGFGAILASVAAAEIDDVGRFRCADKLCAYAGLVPGTRASGGKIYEGRLLRECNKWLRWAFVEAAWVAVGCSGYFGQIYRAARARGKRAQTSILIVAHRMCQIAWRILREERGYEPAPPARAESCPRPLRAMTGGSPARAGRGA